MVTLFVGKRLKLLLDSCVGGRTLNYDQVKQINWTANCFWAESGCSGSYVEWISKYL